jgi:CHAD domain-containing protein
MFCFSAGRMSLLDRGSGAELAGATIGSEPGRLVADDVSDPDLRAVLRTTIDVRALLPVAAVRSELTLVGVLDDAGKTVARVEFDQPSAWIRTLERAEALRPRARTIGLRGYAEDLGAVELLLRDGLGFEPDSEPVLEEAMLALGVPPGGVSSKVNVKLLPLERADEAATKILLRLVEVIEANLPGTITDIDAEFLHDLRVAVRRTRSVQRELAGVFAPEALAFWRGELRWLQAITGPARDMDVYVLDFEEFRAAVPAAFQADLDPLLSVLKSRRLVARGGMVRELRSARAQEALSGWRAFLERLPGMREDDRPAATREIASVAAERIAKVYRQMMRMGDAITPDTPAEPYHELRKKGKELRYLLELFGAQLFDQDVVAPMVKSLKALQDTLGRHQDREVQVATLRTMTGEVSAMPGGDAALMAMGLLVERLGRDEVAAREEFASRFAVFGSKEQRKLVKQTFAL